MLNSDKNNKRRHLSNKAKIGLIDIIRKTSDIYKSDDLESLSDERLIQIKQALFLNLRRGKNNTDRSKGN
jgi:hypothetical protein